MYINYINYVNKLYRILFKVNDNDNQIGIENSTSTFRADNCAILNLDNFNEKPFYLFFKCDSDNMYKVFDRH